MATYLLGADYLATPNFTRFTCGKFGDLPSGSRLVISLEVIEALDKLAYPSRAESTRGREQEADGLKSARGIWAKNALDFVAGLKIKNGSPVKYESYTIEVTDTGLTDYEKLKEVYKDDITVVTNNSVGTISTRFNSISVMGYSTKMVPYTGYRKIKLIARDAKKWMEEGVLYVDLNHAFWKKYSQLVANEFILFENNPMSGQAAYTMIGKFDSRARAIVSLDHAEKAPCGIMAKDDDFQRIMLEVLLGDEPIKILAASAGLGKTLLALAVGVQGVYDGLYKKVVYVPPIYEIGPSLGALPGGERAKLIGQTAGLDTNIPILIKYLLAVKMRDRRGEQEIQQQLDALKEEVASLGRTPEEKSKKRKLGTEIKKFDRALKDARKLYSAEAIMDELSRIIEVVPVNRLQGASLHRTFCIVDEAQHLDADTLYLVATRVADDDGISGACALLGDPMQMGNDPKSKSGIDGMTSSSRYYFNEEGASQVLINCPERVKRGEGAALAVKVHSQKNLRSVMTEAALYGF